MLIIIYTTLSWFSPVSCINLGCAHINTLIEHTALPVILVFMYRFRAEAAIVNYYQLGATLSGHTDHSEDDLSTPLISIRFVYGSMKKS